MVRVKHCALCGSGKFSTIFPLIRDRQFGIEGTFQIMQCRSCKLLFTNPQPAEQEMRKYYPADYSTHVRPIPGYAGFMRKMAARLLFRMFSDFHSRGNALTAALFEIARVRSHIEQWNVHFFPRNAKGLRVFDVGCGDGIFARRLTGLGMFVTGCEIDPVAAGRARTNKVNVIEEDFERVPFTPESFDMVTMIHVLEHFHSPMRILAKACSMLKKGGRLLVVVPNSDALSRHVFREHWFNWDVPRHLFHFSGDTLKRACEKAGFQTAAIETRAHASIWIDSIRSILGLNPLQEFGLPPFRSAHRKVHDQLCVLLNDMSRGDHLAGCFMKPSQG